MQKILSISLLGILLCVPLIILSTKITERQTHRYHAEVDIAQSWTGAQSIVGPILSVPWTRNIEKRTWRADTKRYETWTDTKEELLLVAPVTLEVNAQIHASTRSRGIYPVPVYVTDAIITGSFDNDTLRTVAARPDFGGFGGVHLAIGVHDTRGLREQPLLTWNHQPTRVTTGSSLSFHRAGFNALLQTPDIAAPTQVVFELTLSLQGMKDLMITPVGDTTRVHLRSSWPHPRFQGRFLPVARNISDDGFDASWQTSSFSTENRSILSRCGDGDCHELLTSKLGVALIDPVDIYSLALRATRYGVLFIGVTFAAFYAFEVLRALRIHPVQYTFVGLSLCVFYLLLISLSEHMNFLHAYVIAAVACCSLLGVYTAHILRNRAGGMLMTAGMGTLYGVLYVIIRAEDFALLMGALLIFFSLTLIMLATRRVDWYQFTRALPRSGVRSSAPPAEK